MAEDGLDLGLLLLAVSMAECDLDLGLLLSAASVAEHDLDLGLLLSAVSMDDDGFGLLGLHRPCHAVNDAQRGVGVVVFEDLGGVHSLLVSRDPAAAEDGLDIRLRAGAAGTGCHLLRRDTAADGVGPDIQEERRAAAASERTGLDVRIELVAVLRPGHLVLVLHAAVGTGCEQHAVCDPE